MVDKKSKVHTYMLIIMTDLYVILLGIESMQLKN